MRQPSVTGRGITLATVALAAGMGWAVAVYPRRTVEGVAAFIIAAFAAWLGPVTVVVLAALFRFPLSVTMGPAGNDLFLVLAVPVAVAGFVGNGASRVTAACIALLGVLFTYTLVGIDRSIGVATSLYSLAYYGLPLLFLGVGLAWGRWSRERTQLRHLVVAVALISACAVFFEAAGHAVALYSQLGFTTATGQIAPSYLTNVFGHLVVRNTGIFINPDFSGSLLALGAIWAVSDPTWGRAARWTLFLALSVAMVLTYARSGIFEEAVGLAYWVRATRGRIVGATFLAVLGMSVLGASLGPSFLALNNGSAQYHIASLVQGARLFLEYPLGAGLGSTGIAGNSTLLASTVGGVQHYLVGSETGWLQYLDQIGIGGLAVLGVFLWVVFDGLRGIASHASRAAIAGLLMWAVCLIFLPGVNQVEFTAAVWVAVGMGLGVRAPTSST